MDWLVLIILVPTMVFLVVLLYEFTGCAALVPLDPYTAAGPSAPYNLRATLLGEKKIELRWDHDDIANVEFKVTESDSVDPKPRDFRTGPPGTSYLRTDSDTPPLVPGRKYFYTVRARRPGDTSPNAYSDASNQASVGLPEWQVAYDKPLNAAGASTDILAEFIGACLVQRIDASLLSFTGTVSKVKLSLRGALLSPGDSVSIDKVCISSAAPKDKAGNPDPDPYDSDEPPKTMTGPIIVPGTNNAIPPEPPAVPVGPVDFALKKEAPGVLISFDISGSQKNDPRKALFLGKLNIGVTPSAGYVKPNPPPPKPGQAEIENKDMGFNPKPNTVYLVEKIEFLTTPP